MARKARLVVLAVAVLAATSRPLAHKDLCWDIPGSRQARGASLQLCTIRTVVRDGSYWKINNLCVDAPANSDRIAPWTCNSGPTKRFDDDDDDHDLTAYNGKCIAVQGSVFRCGQALNRQDCEGDEVRFEVEQL